MKKNGFKEATKKIKENYLCSMIAKATEYSVDSLNEKEMNEINSLISQLNAKTLSLVYSQFVINIMNKGISQDSAKWIEKICLKELPSSIFIPYQTSHLKQSFKDSSQTPLAFILTKASSEQASLFFSLYQDLINTIVEKTKFDTQELIYSIQEISLVDCSYTKEVIKKILLKNQSLLNDKNKKDIAIMLLNQEGAKSFNQYKNIIENKNISSTKIFEILALLDAQNIYQDKEAMSNIFFPDLLLDNCTERSRIELSINLGVKNLVSFIKLANLNEQEVKNYFFNKQKHGYNIDFESVSMSKIVQSFSTPLKDQYTYKTIELINFYNKVAKELNFNTYSVKSINTYEAFLTLFEKINLEVSLSKPQTPNKKVKI